MKIKKIFAVPHFHFDVNWWKPYEFCAQDACKIIGKALELLRKHPEFTYVLDQVLAIKPYLDANPKAGDRLRRLIQARRVEVVGGTISSPDLNLPYGEALIRELVLGREYLRKELGVEPRVGWAIDQFGHPAQIPQIYSKMGFRFYVFSRGVVPWYAPLSTDFIWEGPDGSELLTHWFPGTYSGVTKFIPFFPYKTQLEGRIDYLSTRSPTPNLMVPFGSDYCMPDEEWVKLVCEWNGQRKPEISFSTPSEYLETVSHHRLDSRRGEFNPCFTGCYESREKVKKLTRLAQNVALQAERFATLAYLLSGTYPKKRLRLAWGKVVRANSHDMAPGTTTDPVYRRNLGELKKTIELLTEIREDSIRSISKLVDTRGPGVPFLVFNPLAWGRKEIVEVDANADRCVVDEHGERLPQQRSGGKILFKADVPALGYRTYFLKPGKPKAEKSGRIERDHFKFEFDRAGCLKKLIERRTGTNFLDPKKWPANELLIEEDVGNLWTIHLTGRKWKFKGTADLMWIERGPLRFTAEVKKRTKNLQYLQQITFSSGAKRIDFKTFLDFKGKDRRVKVGFAPSFRGKATFETPFYSEEGRGEGHWCAQNWVDLSDGKLGLGLINVGIPSYELEEGTLWLGLMRSVSIIPSALGYWTLRNLRGILERLGMAIFGIFKGVFVFEWLLYDYHGLTLREHASEGGLNLPGVNLIDRLFPYLTPWRESDAWERGRHEFSHSLLPHRGDWRKANPPEEGWELNNPMLVRKARPHRGKLPKLMSFCEIRGENAVLSAFKKAERGPGICLRIYESFGKDSKLNLKLFKKVRQARKVSLSEEEKYEELKTAGSEVPLKLGKWEISTVKLEL